MAVAGRINYGGMWACVSVSLPSKNYISSVWGEHMGRRQSDYYTSLPASQLATVPALWQHLLLISSRYWPCTLLYYVLRISCSLWSENKILTDNKGIGNFPGDIEESNIQNQTSSRPVFQLVFPGKTFCLSCWHATQPAYTAEGHYKAQILRTIHIFIFRI